MKSKKSDLKIKKPKITTFQVFGFFKNLGFLKWVWTALVIPRKALKDGKGLSSSFPFRNLHVDDFPTVKYNAFIWKVKGGITETPISYAVAYTTHQFRCYIRRVIIYHVKRFRMISV